MTFDPPENTLDKLRILADAVFVTCRIGKERDISPALQKCVLFHLLSFEGRPISATALRDRTGMGRPTISGTIQLFLRRGLLRARYTPACRNKTRIFDVNWPKLQAMGRPTLLVGLSGTAGAAMKRERVRATNLLPDLAREAAGTGWARSTTEAA